VYQNCFITEIFALNFDYHNTAELSLCI